jgi:hypothetical protein
MRNRRLLKRVNIPDGEENLKGIKMRGGLPLKTSEILIILPAALWNIFIDSREIANED